MLFSSWIIDFQDNCERISEHKMWRGAFVGFFVEKTQFYRSVD